MSNPIATSADDIGDVVVFAKVPERLEESERCRRYDRPLAAALAESGVGAFLRGFSPVGGDGRIMWVGLEVRLHALADAAVFIECLQRLGAPPETIFEYETSWGGVQFSLAEATGN